VKHPDEATLFLTTPAEADQSGTAFWALFSNGASEPIAVICACCGDVVPKNTLSISAVWETSIDASTDDLED